MNFWDFVNNNGFGCFMITWIGIWFIYKCWNRMMRHLNIRKQGWPPPHCDADGDFKPEPDDD